tara:strand:- start:2 stop:496 length:495 start_codon:yes stop_codon:yes gene_type:complete
MNSLLLYTTTCHECYGFGLTPESKRILARSDSVEVRELSDGRIVESCQACDYESVTEVDPYADVTIVDKPVPKQVVPPSSPLAFKEQGVVIVDVPKASCTWEALNGGSQYGPMPRRNLLDAINAVGIESIVDIKKRDKRLGGVSVKTLAENPPKVQGVFWEASQ